MITKETLHTVDDDTVWTTFMCAMGDDAIEEYLMNETEGETITPAMARACIAWGFDQGYQYFSENGFDDGPLN
jgi:hypothetical protein